MRSPSRWSAVVRVVPAYELSGSMRRYPVGMEAVWSEAYVTSRDAATDALRHPRILAVVSAAHAAALTDPHFGPAHVRDGAAAFFREVQAAWSERDRSRLRNLVADDLMCEWDLILDDFAAKGWVNRVEVHAVTVEYVGLVNHRDPDADRVVVRISAHMDDYVTDADGTVIPHNGNPGRESWLREYWTLAPRGTAWRLVHLEQDEEGAHNLTDPLVPLPGPRAPAA